MKKPFHLLFLYLILVTFYSETYSENLEKEIMVDFSEAPCGDRSKILNYFIQSRLKELTESIGDF